MFKKGMKRPLQSFYGERLKMKGFDPEPDPELFECRIRI
jgi:hypothetical protein